MQDLVFRSCYMQPKAAPFAEEVQIKLNIKQSSATISTPDHIQEGRSLTKEMKIAFISGIPLSLEECGEVEGVGWDKGNSSCNHFDDIG